MTGAIICETQRRHSEERSGGRWQRSLDNLTWLTVQSRSGWCRERRAGSKGTARVLGVETRMHLLRTIKLPSEARYKYKYDGKGSYATRRYRRNYHLPEVR